MFYLTWSSIVNLDCREIEFQGDEWIQLPQDRDELRSTGETMFWKQQLPSNQGSNFDPSESILLSNFAELLPSCMSPHTI